MNEKHLNLILTGSVTAAAVLLSGWAAAADVCVLRPSAPSVCCLWQSLVCHLVHWTPEHLFYDASCFAIIAAMLPWRQVLRCYLLAAPAIAAAVMICHPDMAAYGGLSGVNCALVALWALRIRSQSPRLGTAALATIILKTALEIHVGHTFFVNAAFAPVSIAHVIGILSGCLAFFGEKMLSQSNKSNVSAQTPRTI